MLAELRAHRELFGDLVQKLGDRDEADTGSYRSDAARLAPKARWAEGWP